MGSESTEKQITFDFLRSTLQQAGKVAINLVEMGRKEEGDFEVNKFILKSLTEFDDEIGWLSEETKDDLVRLTRKFVWIVDPIDGTKEYLKDSPEYSISIALVDEFGSHRAAGVYCPKGDYGLIAINKELQPFGKISKTTYEKMPILVSKTEHRKGVFDPISDYATIIPMGSVALKLMRLSLGLEAGYLSLEPKSTWDICGGRGLLEANGLLLERIDRKPIKFNSEHTRIESGLLAGTPDTVAKLREMLKLLSSRNHE